jgi:hypothetical protein
VDDSHFVIVLFDRLFEVRLRAGLRELGGNASYILGK